MTLDGAGARALGEVRMVEFLRRFENIRPNRGRKTIRGDHFKLLLPANRYDCAADYPPAPVRSHLLAGAGLFALDDCRVLRRGRNSEVVADTNDFCETVGGTVNDSGSRVTSHDFENSVGLDNEGIPLGVGKFRRLGIADAEKDIRQCCQAGAVRIGIHPSSGLADFRFNRQSEPQAEEVVRFLEPPMPLLPPRSPRRSRGAGPSNRPFFAPFRSAVASDVVRVYARLRCGWRKAKWATS
jgi:hypothetical protein